jgi:hypothetical protein
MTSLFGQLRKLALVGLAFAMPLTEAVPALAAGSDNIAKVDIVREGIDLAPLVVRSNSSGYIGTINDPHRFMVRVFAKAKGQKAVWAVTIYDPNSQYKYYEQTVGKSEGWEVYNKSHTLIAKPRDLAWYKTPVEVCRENMAKLMAEGMSKAQVLGNDRKVNATTYIAFNAWADTKAHNRKNNHKTYDGFTPSMWSTHYQVPVVCQAAL